MNQGATEPREVSIRPVALFLYLTVITLTGWNTPAAAQIRKAASVPMVNYKTADYEAGTYIPPFPAGMSKNDLAQSAVFEIDFTDNFPAEARRAFQYAADVWGRYLRSPIPITIEAEWTELPERTLGSAGPLLVGDFMSSVYAEAWYPSALANALLGEDPFPEDPDIQASFNSAFTQWYFGTDGQVPAGRYDFVSVVLHELGHGLGFTGSLEVDDGDAENGDECPGVTAGYGCWGLRASGGDEVYPMLFDLFTEDAREVSLLIESIYPNPSESLARTLQSGRVFFDGTFSRPINEDIPINLYAPNNFEPGSSYSHLDEETFPSPPGGPADPNSLMTPFLARGEAVHSPGDVTCAIFEDFGWPMGEGCLALLASPVAVEDDPALPDPYEVSPLYPNPTAGPARTTFTATSREQVRIEVYNVAGQRVWIGEPGLAEIGHPLPIEIDLSGQASGVYFVRLQGSGFSIVQPLVVSRE